MRLRSLLFVPGDRPERFAKAEASGADAVILDLEDSVAPARKGDARQWVAQHLAGPRAVRLIVRINPLGSGMAQDDLDAILPARPDGVMLPKAEGSASLRRLFAMMGSHEVPVLPIATETPQALFRLGTYARHSARLLGLTWGAEDLPAAIGAIAAREEDGRLTPPYEMVRSLALFAAHAASVPAIETVYPDLKNSEGLAAYVQRARRDGFGGMMALHPAQVPVINRGFTPDEQAVEHARRIVEAFDRAPDSGVLLLDGQMIDRPHLVMARRVLANAGEAPA
ncbi:MAG: CoA ester lyase [Sphingomonadales bacterium]|nr:CoA ester lyase [Sphingomonadales bacterium]MDE2172057.1 CoA ester lyase [Sphingomonadales bacterium]